MDILIDKELANIKSHIIDYATLKAILEKYNYKRINDKIENLKQQGIIKSLKKGLYVHTSMQNNIISKELIANSLLSPSYISLDYALSFYGLIPEMVVDVVSITTKRAKAFKTDYGVFEYKHIKKELYPIGLKIYNANEYTFLIATKEKALCDKIFFTKNLQISSKKRMLEFLVDDLRIDLDEMESFDKGVISSYYSISKSKKIKVLLELVNEYN